MMSIHHHQILRKKTIITLTTSIIIMIGKVNLGHNASVCDNLGEFPEIQMKSQKLIAAVQVMSIAARLAHILPGLHNGNHIVHILTPQFCLFYFFLPKSWTMVQGLNGALQSLPTIVVAFFAGPIFDRSPVT